MVCAERASGLGCRARRAYLFELQTLEITFLSYYTSKPDRHQQQREVGSSAKTDARRPALRQAMEVPVSSPGVVQP